MLLTMAIVGFLALLAVASSGVLIWLVMRLSEKTSKLERESRALAGECRALHLKVDALPVNDPAEVCAPPRVMPLSGDTGMNLSKRVQILRLNRRGESPAHIASVLNLPLAQVELVLKLQKHVAEGPLESLPPRPSARSNS